MMNRSKNFNKSLLAKGGKINYWETKTKE